MKNKKIKIEITVEYVGDELHVNNKFSDMNIRLCDAIHVIQQSFHALIAVGKDVNENELDKITLLECYQKQQP